MRKNVICLMAIICFSLFACTKEEENIPEITGAICSGVVAGVEAEISLSGENDHIQKMSMASNMGVNVTKSEYEERDQILWEATKDVEGFEIETEYLEGDIQMTVYIDAVIVDFEDKALELFGLSGIEETLQDNLLSEAIEKIEELGLNCKTK